MSQADADASPSWMRPGLVMAKIECSQGVRLAAFPWLLCLAGTGPKGGRGRANHGNERIVLHGGRGCGQAVSVSVG